MRCNAPGLFFACSCVTADLNAKSEPFSQWFDWDDNFSANPDCFNVATLCSGIRGVTP